MRVILVTGANGGLGQAIARSFLEESTGNFVWLAIRTSHEQADRLADQFAGRAATLGLNVTDPLSWQTALKIVFQRHERVDVLVNNAGKHHDGLLATLEQNAWDDVLATNLDSVF